MSLFEVDSLDYEVEESAFATPNGVAQVAGESVEVAEGVAA